MPTHGLDGCRFGPQPFQVELEADAGQAVGTERQGFVEGGEIGRDAPQTFEIATAHAPTRSAMTHLAQIVRVREDESAVGEVENVKLQHVAAELHRELERLQSVLGRQRGSATVTDAHEPAFRSTQLDQAVRLTTTTAQSSASSPRANARQSSSTTCASSFADRSRLSDSTRSRRSTPYISLSRRASMTPSV